MTAAAMAVVEPLNWDKPIADAAAEAKPPTPPHQRSNLELSLQRMLHAACASANEAGIIDVLRDIHPDSIILGMILTARLIAACNRIVQLPPITPAELSENLLIAIVIAEKLLNDAPFTDLLAMIAAALDIDARTACQLEFRVLSIVSVHEGTIATSEEHAAMLALVVETAWQHLDVRACIDVLMSHTRRMQNATKSAEEPAVASAASSTLSSNSFIGRRRGSEPVTAGWTARLLSGLSLRTSSFAAPGLKGRTRPPSGARRIMVGQPATAEGR